MTSLSNRWYDILKTLTQIILPGAGTLYFALAGIWAFPYAEEVVGTLAAIAVFLGLFLRSSSKSFDKDPAKHDGEFKVLPVDQVQEGTAPYAFVVETAPEKLATQKRVSFLVTGEK